MRDPIAHRPRANNSDCFDFTHESIAPGNLRFMPQALNRISMFLFFSPRLGGAPAGSRLPER
jgi:hypothetical protein